MNDLPDIKTTETNPAFVLHKKTFNKAFGQTWPYALFIAIISFYARYYYGHLYPDDAVSYLSIAEKYSAGKWGTAINGYWSPMISCLIALQLKAGIAGIPAFYIIKLVSGLLIIFFSNKIVSLFHWPEWAQIACKAIIAAFAAYFTLRSLSPDALMAAGLLLYLYFVLTGKWLKNCWLTGLLGASLYFTKAFGFYFFAAHLLLYIFWKLFSNKKEFVPLLKKVSIILITFISISGLWIIALHSRYHQWIISSAGSYNHNLMQYGDGSVQPALKMGLLPLPDSAAYNSWEEITLVHTYTDWKPWENSQNFLLQIKVIGKNGWFILKHTYGTSRMSWPVLAASVLLSIWYIIYYKRGKPGWRKHVHTAAFVLLYATGYAAAGVDDRYLYIVDVGLLFLLFDWLVWLQKRKLMNTAGFYVLAGLFTFQCVTEVIIKLQLFKKERASQLNDVSRLRQIIPQGSTVATHATNSINVIDYLAKWHNHGGLQAYQNKDAALQALRKYRVEWVLIPDSVQQRYSWLIAESDTFYAPKNWRVFKLKK